MEVLQVGLCVWGEWGVCGGCVCGGCAFVTGLWKSQQELHLGIRSQRRGLAELTGAKAALDGGTPGSLCVGGMGCDKLGVCVCVLTRLWKSQQELHLGIRSQRKGLAETNWCLNCS